MLLQLGIALLSLQAAMLAEETRKCCLDSQYESVGTLNQPSTYFPPPLNHRRFACDYRSSRSSGCSHDIHEISAGEPATWPVKAGLCSKNEKGDAVLYSMCCHPEHCIAWCKRSCLLKAALKRSHYEKVPGQFVAAFQQFKVGAGISTIVQKIRLYS